MTFFILTLEIIRYIEYEFWDYFAYNLINIR